jgi:two-component system sensor histidine kinase KdpD
MGRGRLRLLLGAAPGVGKTFTMLEEGRRLLEEGHDVVIALVETHGRAGTAAMAEGLEVLPTRTISYRGVNLQEMDLDAVLRRAPEIALVDELAHTNVPGSQHEKRWEDVEALLEAGIDVISTVNIQHIESLNDVVETITGVPQRETVPDSVLRKADQIEVVDLDPQSLRDRLASGHVYPAERIDAALSNYFRLGNLTALRELALLWLADEVDSALQRYRSEHGIDNTWEARERVVVALSGGVEGETLLRRAARIAARSSGGELIAVHVTTPDGLRSSNEGLLARQRLLVERLGGTFHQVVGENIPDAMVAFARAMNATQLVLGASRKSRWTTAIAGPGIGARVIRDAGNIDVHIVNHAAANQRLTLPRSAGSLTPRRQIAGFIIALAGGPLLTLLLTTFRSDESIASDVLSYQLLVVIVALVGGAVPAIFAAILSGITLDFFLIDPIHTLTIGESRHVLALILYVVIAILVSLVVSQAAYQTRAARRSAAESELLAMTAGSVLRGQDALQALIERTREAFHQTRVRLIAEEVELASDESATLASEQSTLTIPVGDRAHLELTGPDLEASSRRLLTVIVAQIEAALDHRDLQVTASEIQPLATSDKVRSALLSAMSHDVRRPLAAATTAIGGLRSSHSSLTEADRDELLATADESLQQLATLIMDLLDVSRVQAGVLGVKNVPVDPADVIVPALDELGLGPDQVELDLDASPDLVLADEVLLKRVLVNLLANAIRHTPQGARVRIAVSSFAGKAEIRVIDHGPGVPIERRQEIFVPFQRMVDTDNLTGLGLGLALSKGFAEGMGGTLTPEETPGGGLTMVVTLDLPSELEHPEA